MSDADDTLLKNRVVDVFGSNDTRKPDLLESTMYVSKYKDDFSMVPLSVALI